MFTKIFYRFWDFWLRLPEKLRLLFLGGFNSILIYVIFVILSLIVGRNYYQYSLLVAWIVSSFISFSGMKIFVFCSNDGWCAEYYKCVISWVFNYFCNAIFLWICVDIFGVSIYLAQLAAFFIYTGIIYFIYTHFVFRH